MQMGTICLTNGSQTEDPKVLHVRGQESTTVDTVNVTPDDWVKRDKRMIRLTGKVCNVLLRSTIVQACIASLQR